MKNALLPKAGSRWLILLLALLLTCGSQARLRFDEPAVRPGIKSAPDRPSGVATKSKLRPSKRQQVPASNDPIRFTLQASKRQLTVGEEVELTITAQLMNISPTLLFFLPGSNAYTLKILSPTGFQATGGDFSEYIRGELSYPANTMATYHLRGFFTSPTDGVTFRLLRGEGQATSQSLYEEKARLQLVVQAETNGAARLDDPCSGISLSAQASPNSVSGGGVVNLSATCTGCSSGGGGSTLYSTNFTGEVPNSSFQTDYSDQVKVITNAQNGTDTYYCPVTDHSGTGGTLLRFNGESAGRVWEKSLNVVSGTTYSFTLWVQPVYNGSVASGATQQTLQLKANGALLGSPTFGASNPGCSSGWVQVSGSWTATTTGSVPFTVQVPSGSSWQQAFVLDDIQISSGSGGGGSAASYSWQALESGSTLANASSATAQATVPSTAGTYHYRVTLTSGSCTMSQDVTITVTSSTTCISKPGYGNVYADNCTYLPQAETGRLGSNEQNGAYDRQYIDNSYLKVGVNQTLAGGLDYISINGGQNYINSPIWSNGRVDAGRQMLWSWYSSPAGAGHEFTQNGQTTHGIGWNAVEAGNEGNRGGYGELHVMHHTNTDFYIKNSGNQWDLEDVTAEQDNEKWISFDPTTNKAFRTHTRLTMRRTDNQSPFPLQKGQEAPCFMLTADFGTVFYSKDQPYTNTWSSITPAQASGGAQPLFSTEPFIAIMKNQDGSGEGFGLYAPYTSRFAINNDRQGSNHSSSTDFNVFYTASSPQMHLDNDGVYDFDVAVFYGTLAEIRSWAYSQPRWSGTFDYVFNQKSRLGWLYHSSKDQLEKNITDGLSITPNIEPGNSNANDMNISSPEKWINGRVVKHIYIQGSWAGPSGQMEIVWKKYNDTQERRHTFNVTHDNNVRVLDIDMTGVTDWDGQDILNFTIQYLYSERPSDTGSATWNIKRVSSSPIN